MYLAGPNIPSFHVSKYDDLEAAADSDFLDGIFWSPLGF